MQATFLGMYTIPIGLLATALYIAGTVIQGMHLRQALSWHRTVVFGCGFVAIGVHSVLVYGQIYRSEGVNLSFVNMGSLISWIIAGLVLFSALRKPLENLFVLLFPVAALAICVSVFTESPYEPRTDLSADIYSHILLSIIAYSILSIAAFQALLLAYQNRQLRRKAGLAVLKALPPLQTMEALLFELLAAGLLLLTLSILTGFFFLEDMFAQHLVHHTFITLASWFVFVILLWGRYQLGWRGNTAIGWTIGGFVILLIGYWGSKLVLEIILQRV